MLVSQSDISSNLDFVLRLKNKVVKLVSKERIMDDKEFSHQRNFDNADILKEKLVIVLFEVMQNFCEILHDVFCMLADMVYRSNKPIFHFRRKFFVFTTLSAVFILTIPYSTPIIANVALSDGVCMLNTQEDLSYNLASDFPRQKIPALKAFKELRSIIDGPPFEAGSYTDTYMYRPYARRRGSHIPLTYTLSCDKPIIVQPRKIDNKIRSDRLRIVRKILKDHTLEESSIRYLEFTSSLLGKMFYPIGSYLNYDDKPISYETFLTCVFLALSEIKIGTPDSIYLPFVNDVLLPLSADLSIGGLARPRIVVDKAFLDKLDKYVHQDKSEEDLPLQNPAQVKYLLGSFTFSEAIPHEILWANIYRRIGSLIRTGYYKDPYHLYKYYKELSIKEDDIMSWGEILDVNIWCNYYIDRLNESTFSDKIDEIKCLMLNFEEVE